MASQVKNPALRSYTVYLNVNFPTDKRLIDMLEPFVDAKRVGELMRLVLAQHFAGSSLIPSVVQLPAAERVSVALPAAVSQMPHKTDSVSVAKANVRYALFK